MSLVVASKVKEYCKGLGVMCAGDLPDHLSTLLEDALKKGAGRCRANNRKTMRGEDL
jgi:hypothetical protein